MGSGLNYRGYGGYGGYGSYNGGYGSYGYSPYNNNQFGGPSGDVENRFVSPHVILFLMLHNMT